MATIGTSTATNSFTNAFGYPPCVMMDLNVKTGVLWMVFKDQTNRAAVYKSTNNGGSWTFETNFTVASGTIEDICEMRVDPGGDHLHMALLIDAAGGEEFHYKRLGIGTGSVGPATGTARFSGPSGSLQSVQYSCAVLPVKNPDGSWYIVFANTQRGSSSGVSLFAMTIKNDGTFTTRGNNALIGPTRVFKASGDDSQMVCSIDVEHNGDGITSATPNLWVTWLHNTTLRTIRCTWKGYKTGWQTPSKATDVATGRISERDAVARWIGDRYVIASVNPAAQAQMQLFERNANNTGNTAIRTSPSIGLGSITGARAMSYNHVTKDIRLFVVVGANTVYYIDYFRQSNTWGSWTTTGWTTPLASEWGVRRGTYGTNQYDAYTETGGGSPWTISNQIQAVNFAPTAPTWSVGQPGTVTENGAAFDVSSNLTLDWSFTDPNTADTQSAYALERKIGVAASEWWRTSDNTWQPAETFNTTSTTSVVLTPVQWLGGLGDADPAHVYKVAVKDSGTPTLTSPYSSGLSLVPSTRVDPTVTSPTVNQILNVSYLPVTWTVTEQRQWRVQVKPAIANDTFTRSVSNAWGNADYGGPWFCTGGAASDFSVSSNSGRVAHSANNVSHDCLLSISADNVNLYVGSVSPSAAPATQPLEWGARTRYVDANNYVETRIAFRPGNVPQVILRSVVAGVVTSTTADTAAGTPTSGPVSARFVVDGSNLYARVWTAANAEPTDWSCTMAATLQEVRGALQINTLAVTGNTTTKPVTFITDDIILQDSSLVDHDTGFVTDVVPLSPTTLSYTVPVALPDGYAGVVNLTTKNIEGLSSQMRTVPFTVDFVEPVAPTITALAAAPSSGGINVTLTQGAATGTQPATTSLSIYRRKTVAGTLVAVNSNPFIETNANDWGSNGYASVVRSTAQFHQGVASLFMTPNGSNPTPKAQTGLYAASPGELWEWRGWVRSTTANKPIRMYLEWCDISFVPLATTTRDLTPVANVWIWGNMVGLAPLGTAFVRMIVGQADTPAAGDTLYADELEMMPANNDPGIVIKSEAVSGTQYLDWRAVTGVDYEYRGYAEAANGTTIYGPWTD